MLGVLWLDEADLFEDMFAFHRNSLYSASKKIECIKQKILVLNGTTMGDHDYLTIDVMI